MTPSLSSKRVLSTLEADGRRRWLHPKLSKGRFLRNRRIVGYALIVMFVLLPRIRIGGRPALLIDLMSREVDVFGAVFRPSDGFVLMLLGLSIALAVFLLTALFGRVWCGWACPQSVYLEHVFRPIERWLEGPARRHAKSQVRRAIKWTIFAGLSFALSNVFLAYFVGTERLEHWVFESPLDHVAGFTVVMTVAALMFFDFAYFREQVCILACPYGRLQAVLLDRQSLIVGYDGRRGEPRGKPGKHLKVVGEGALGDCVDCNACVATCPTGIDIRDGLQMECIGCAQCIDACDAVMAKLGRAPNLIGYTSKDRLEGKPGRLLRARTVIYPALLAITTGFLIWSASSRPETEVWIVRAQGAAFVALPDHHVAAQIRVKLENETANAQHYRFVLVDAPDAELRAEQAIEIKSRRSLELTMFADMPRAAFHAGRRVVHLRVTSDRGFDKTIPVTLLGPVEGAPE